MGPPTCGDVGSGSSEDSYFSGLGVFSFNRVRRGALLIADLSTRL